MITLTVELWFQWCYSQVPLLQLLMLNSHSRQLLQLVCIATEAHSEQLDESLADMLATVLVRQCICKAGSWTAGICHQPMSCRLKTNSKSNMTGSLMSTCSRVAILRVLRQACMLSS